MEKLVVTTMDSIPGKTITAVLGVVKGNTIRAKWFGKDIIAGLRQIVGGEIKEYTEMMTEAREEALKRMEAEGMKLKADAIVNVRFSTSMIMTAAAEILAYGTAVKVR